MAKTAASSPDALPDWNAVYSLASWAMKSFRDGGADFETGLDTWTIAARPVVAGSERCVSCHNHQAGKSLHEVRLGQPSGGVRYDFRQPRD